MSNIKPAGTPATEEEAWGGTDTDVKIQPFEVTLKQNIKDSLVEYIETLKGMTLKDKDQALQDAIDYITKELI